MEVAQKKAPQADNALKFTPELGHDICVRVETIGFETVAAELSGVHRNTVRNWRERGESGEPMFREFALKLAEAKAKYAQTHLGKIVDSKWLLERFDRATFGPVQDVNVKAELNLQDYRNKSTEDLRKEALAAAEGKDEQEP